MAISHSDTCFSRKYGRLESEAKVYDKGGVKLASCLVVQDRANKVFLTLRTAKLRVFPNAWVLPGGHIDPGESLEEGVIRELSEETGIQILRHPDGTLSYKNKQVTLKPYYAFESSIPTGWTKDSRRDNYNPVGCPIGHLIVYFYVKIDLHNDEIDINLSPHEVAACVWLNREQMQHVLFRNHEERE